MKLNLGSFSVTFKGWLNIDLLNHPSLYMEAAHKGHEFISMDLRHGLPWNDNSIEAIYSSHMIEHITYREAESFMSECRRVLIPGGTMRLAVPDLGILVNMYQNGSLKELNEINEPSTRANYDVERFWEVLTADHKAAYDFRTMEELCRKVGFDKIYRREFGQGNQMIVTETKDLFPSISLYMELIK